ncbi:hypothetical protein KMW28_27120 [Flammeovirga yaeyamensis]|uniref:Uncharacterized protein n=1 Tax=Flammeovirga yaeyamensis TaxID=367791 RepID=A0AAX1NAR7_9BACT|nr:hypothetical protein [Flammeovirga yaeyamensis]MBB3700048.1 putative nucleic acid-binding Zn-ribbon protein [Flammeovirga yaeyamensis]NMF37515.1 hypothetical protein [Flammeovirga yaeyamensis]QWG04572.1 hypothetical protein KMW28_27120 [Flammeovirga yaeyamensis]
MSKEELKAELKALKVQNSALKSALDAKQKQVNEHRVAKENVELQVETLKEQLETLKGTVDDDMRQELDEAVTEIEVHNQKHDSLLHSYNERGDLLKAANQRADTLYVSLTDVEKKLAAIESEKEELESDLFEYKDRVSNSVSTVFHTAELEKYKPNAQMYEVLVTMLSTNQRNMFESYIDNCDTFKLSRKHDNILGVFGSDYPVDVLREVLDERLHGLHSDKENIENYTFSYDNGDFSLYDNDSNEITSNGDLIDSLDGEEEIELTFTLRKWQWKSLYELCDADDHKALVEAVDYNV